MAFDSRLPAAYQEEESVSTVLGSDHLVTFDYAEPSPIMLFLQKWWRRSILMLKVGAVVGAVAAYPVMTVVSNRIDDSTVISADQNWTLPEMGVAINQIARELEGAGWAGDRANWHPQARLTAMPAWQTAIAGALSEYSLTMAEIAGTEDGADSDLTAAARLLKSVAGEDMRPRLTAAAEAINRFDSRAARGLAQLPDRSDMLAAEARLFAGWANADRKDLSEHVHREIVEWPASRGDIQAFYGAKARAHVAEQMLIATRIAEPRLARFAAVDAALTKAETAWAQAAGMKPLIVSNQPGDGPFMANHLASMGFYLIEAEDATRELIEALESLPEDGLESSVAQLMIKAPATAP